MTKASYKITGIFIVLGSIAGLLHFLLYDNLKQNYPVLNGKRGGIVYNHTSKTVKISTDSYTAHLPPKKNSLQIGIEDTDAIIINRDMIYKGKTINNKVLKFCNYETIEILENNKKEILIKERDMSWICSFLNSTKLYSSIKEAFGQV